MLNIIASKTVAIALISLWLSVHATAQSNNDSCGADITARRQYYEIRFFTYCQTKISSPGNVTQIKRASFKDCSTACVDTGKLCGGFAFDRDSHFSENNCYLVAPTDRWQTGSPSENIYYDSAGIDNSSLPLTRSDCLTTGVNKVYGGYDLHCGQRILKGNDSNQLGTVFASSIGDCLDHCKNLTLPSGAPLCEAVTWDPTVFYGYENCYMLGNEYYTPTYDAMWDSATLVGTKGRLMPNSTSTAGSPSSTSTSTSSGTSSPQPLPRLSSAGIAGVVVCSILALAIVVAAIVWYFRRRKNIAAAEAAARTNNPEIVENALPMTTGTAAKTDEAINVHEIANYPRRPIFEADGSHTIHEADGNIVKR